VGVDIPGFIRLLSEGKPLEAHARIRETNVLPAVCGRVCPQESQCEKDCVLVRRGESVAIGRLERYVADFAARLEPKPDIPRPPSNGRKAAIVGSGPAGLACAGDLAARGWAVTVFEAFHEAGGVLVYGIPQFRLPRDVVTREIGALERLGVGFRLNRVVGRSFPPDELLGPGGFDALFVGVGAGLPVFMGVPGENLGGIYSANEYLTRTYLMRAWRFPEYDTPVLRGGRVVVVGGGNVAMDAARTARRLGAGEVRLVYRRSREELPARREESHHAEEEGVVFQMLSNPVEYRGDGRGRVREVVCQAMELGEPDASGRRRPVPKPDDFTTHPCDMVIVAVGTRAHPLLTEAAPDLALDGRRYIRTGPGGKTSKERVWAGGDITTGSATVILAMGAGRRAAADIHGWFSGPIREWPKIIG
jgi:glutamate synthase (NADPH/NADH) small chain